GYLDIGHADAVLSAYANLTPRIRALNVAALAQGQGNGRHHADEQDDAANLNREDVVGVHGLTKREGVVVVLGACGLRARGTPGRTQHEGHFQHHDHGDADAQWQIGLETGAQVVHADVEHHHDEQEHDQHGTHIDD